MPETTIEPTTTAECGTKNTTGAAPEPELDRELLECAKINFENLEHALPGLSEHPFWIIAKHQLDTALGYPGHPELRDNPPTEEV